MKKIKDFKVGDEVVLPQIARPKEWVDSMDRFLGKTITIKYIWGDNNEFFEFENDGGWTYRLNELLNDKNYTNGINPNNMQEGHYEIY